jgi:phage/plasmid primase-like uncharacterized protein
MHFIGIDEFRNMAVNGEKPGRIPEKRLEVLLAENYASGASLHLATGLPVAVAFTPENFKAAALKLLSKYPAVKVIVCASNDNTQANNHSLGKALEAAGAVQGRVAVPTFTEEEKKSGLTDFNDLHQSRGLDAVAAVLNQVRQTVKTVAIQALEGLSRDPGQEGEKQPQPAPTPPPKAEMNR